MPSESRSRKLVVAGLIVRESQILITQRMKDQALPLKWEFPGGKLEPGESPEAALERELEEELGVEVEVGRIYEVLTYGYPDFDLLMLIYPCQILGDNEPQCREVEDLAWVAPAEMRAYDILEADAPLVKRLIEEGVPEPAFHSRV